MKLYDKDKLLDDQGKSNYINNIKMMLITIVVVGHMLTSVRSGDVIAQTIYNGIYLFHMPAFILVTGYLSKGAVKNVTKLKKTWLNYVVIYLYAQLVYDVIQRLALPQGQTFDFSIFTPRYALWYLFVLILWLPILYIIKSWSKAVVFLSVIAISLLAGLNSQIGTEYSLSRAFVFFMFFLLGYYIDIQKIKDFDNKKIKCAAFAVIVLNFCAHYFLRNLLSVTIYTANVSYDGMGQSDITGVAVRILYLLMATVVTFAVLVLVPKGELIFSYIGGRTLQIYLIHAIVCRVFYIRGTLVPLKEVTSVWFIIILGVTMTILLSYKSLAILVEWPMKLLYNKK